jgi:uncharacterized protein (DUF58 family)
MSLYQRIQDRIANWSRRRHGMDQEPFTIVNRRIYILPTRLGLMFASIVFAMALGGMNYGNNLALMLAFMLTGIGFVAMHHCHRNLAGLQIRGVANEPVFAGQLAHLQLAIENNSSQSRFAIVAEASNHESIPLTVDASGNGTLTLHQPSTTRGWLSIKRLSISTRYPFGLFRAWTVLHLELNCLIYPKPSNHHSTPPPATLDSRSAIDLRRGDDEYSSLREFHAGDSPHRIAWKAYARSDELLVKQYAGAAATAYVLDWDTLQGMDTESRLSQLCRWIVDAHQNGIAYGIKIPGLQLPPQISETHRQQCLKALALFGKES